MPPFFVRIRLIRQEASKAGSSTPMDRHAAMAARRAQRAEGTGGWNGRFWRACGAGGNPSRNGWLEATDLR